MYYNARYYDAQLGRFISADTIVPGAMNPQALNRYTYVLNNPLKYTDPTGHTSCGTGSGLQWEDCPVPENGPEGGLTPPREPEREERPSWRDSRRGTFAVGISVQGNWYNLVWDGSLLLVIDAQGNAALVFSPAGPGVGAGYSWNVSVTTQATNAVNIDELLKKVLVYTGMSGGGFFPIVGVDAITAEGVGGLAISYGFGGGWPIESHTYASFTSAYSRSKPEWWKLSDEEWEELLKELYRLP